MKLKLEVYYEVESSFVFYFRFNIGTIKHVFVVFKVKLCKKQNICTNLRQIKKTGINT